MAATVLGTFRPGSDRWHAARAGGLGGSEIAAVVGLSPWDSPWSLWQRKAGHIGPAPENDEMRWGTLLEPVIVEEFCRRHRDDLSLTDSGVTFAHPDREWQVANPDALFATRQMCGSCDGGLPVGCGCPTEPTCVLEVKTARYDDEWGPDGSDVIPVGYRCQVLWYLDVLGLPTAHVAVLIAGSDYREYVIEYDPAEAAFLRDAGRAFLDSVAAGIEPDVDSHGATYRALRELHPDIDDVATVHLRPGTARGYRAAVRAYRAAEARKALHTARVLRAMGSARRAECNGQPIASRVAVGSNMPHLRPARGLLKEHT